MHPRLRSALVVCRVALSFVFYRFRGVHFASQVVWQPFSFTKTLTMATLIVRDCPARIHLSRRSCARLLSLKEKKAVASKYLAQLVKIQTMSEPGSFLVVIPTQNFFGKFREDKMTDGDAKVQSTR